MNNIDNTDDMIVNNTTDSINDTSSNDSDRFTVDKLTEIIESGKDTVVCYPAGSGKTTAIKEYMSNQENMKFKNSRRIIYVAPTCKILDELYMGLLDCGISADKIFNYHSDSDDYKKILTIKDKDEREKAITSKLQSTRIVLITHARINFESCNRFFNLKETMDGSDKTTRPLVIVDEAIETITVASMLDMIMSAIFRDAGVIGVNKDIDRY